VYEPKLVLITLVIKLGVAAAVAAVTARALTFQRLLFSERRTTAQTIGLLAFLCIPLTLGVWIRLTVRNFYAADIGFETVIVLGILLGPFSAMLGGAVLSLPAMLHHEYLTLPFFLAVAAVSGFYGRAVEPEEVWSFSPFIDLSLYRWIRRNIRQPRVDRQVLLLMLIVGMQIVRMWLARLYPGLLFSLDSSSFAVNVCTCLCPVVAVAIPLKIWNASRIEIKLKEQKQLVLEARLDALQRQINPHFLFNTLNSIASLIRFRPEMARDMIVQLGNILRALLKDHDSYVPFREELTFADDYLGIEVVRFGAEKLRVVKEIDDRTLEVLVPCMMLQPLIENSIKHGLEPRLQGGTITLRSRVRDATMIVEVEDDGVGMADDRSRDIGYSSRGNGIGMRNVRERLEMLYGNGARFEVISRPGRGTRVTLEIPMAPNVVVLADQTSARINTFS
jgi:two-component system, LytTR family, sensor kinase